MSTTSAAARDEVRASERTKQRSSRRARARSHPPPASPRPQSSAEDVIRPRQASGLLQGERQASGRLQGERQVSGLLQGEREEELRWRINQLEKDKLELSSKYNQEVSGYEAQLARLRALLERGEAHRQTLEYEVAVARRDADVQKTFAEEKLGELRKHNQQLKTLSAELSQRVSDLERALEITRQARDEDQQGHQAELHERDRLLFSCNADNDLLHAEKSRLEALLQEQNDTLQELKRKMERVLKERVKEKEELRVKESELKQSSDREKRTRKECESSMQRIKALEEKMESERAAHLESKFKSEVIQQRLRDLEAALCVEKSSQTETVSSLELLRQRFGEVEKAYAHERDRAEDTHRRLLQLEQDHRSAETELIGRLNKEQARCSELIGQLDQERATCAEVIGRLEQEKAESAKLSLKVQEQERAHIENQRTLSLVQQKMERVEDTHQGLMKEMEQLLQHYHHLGAPLSYSAGEGQKLSPTALMEILKTTLHHYHTELKDLVKVVEALNKENKDKENTIAEQRRDIQECETRRVCLGEEVERLRLRCADAAAAADRGQTELRNITQLWEEEREQHTHTRAQIHTLTQEHQRDQQEKLAFLHSLYQQLVAGCVLVAPPQSMLGGFSWAELSAILQEHVEVLTSDLSSANQRVSALESVCEGKAAALVSVCEQLRQREETWIQQRKELDTHHTHTTNELHSMVQELRRQVDVSEERVRVLERARCGLEEEVTRLQELLGVCRRDDASLLAACALLAGCVCGLLQRVCVLASQKALLRERACAGESLEREAGALLRALGDPGVEGHAEERGARRGGAWRFRRCAIVILAALRLRALPRESHTLFRVSGPGETPGVLVREVRLREGSRRGEEEEEEWVRVRNMLRSSELAVIVHSCMQGVQQELDRTDHSSAVLSAAQNSVSKLLQRLLSEPDPGCWRRYKSLGSLARRLGQGLQRLRTTHCSPPSQYPRESMVSSLQQHFLAFTQRLHSAEVERRELRLELSRLKRSAAHTRHRHKDNTHTTCVPVDQFQSVCAELSSALQREQQAQALLHQQATQLRELGLTMELHTGEQLEKDRTLAQAVQSLSEAKAELQRKEQSLRVLGKRLSQSQREKQQLQQSIDSAENALRTAARSKDSLGCYVKLVERHLTELKDRISLSPSLSSGEDLTLNVPTAPTGAGGTETAACQTLIRSFMELYQLLCSKVASLEREISSYQSHITALKEELHDVCVRENQSYVPVMGPDDPVLPLFGAEVDGGAPLSSAAGVPQKDVPENTHPLQNKNKFQTLPGKKSKARKICSKPSRP
ncbi:coiled-coil domain-containing protein 171-like [Hoplias malabaricus]|uniref:coiled-coil domain-containing protein 171-like n=1 Tax=Hoplias malabaricus TaxID=27720 RepID=UPI003461FDCD